MSDGAGDGLVYCLTGQLRRLAAQERGGLERLCRYGLRPSFALERLSVLDDGRVRYKLKRPWPRPGGVTELVMDPVDFLARL
jgi:Putative transposase